MLLDHPRYSVHETLGEGAQGRVVRVVDRERPELRLVAKIVCERERDRDGRLAGEFALLARLRIPGLVRVHDFGRDLRGAVYLVEDQVDGDDSVTAIAGTSDPLERARRLTALAIDIAETLAALHDAGFVHGDLKPSNIRVPRAGRAVLLDLGASVASRVTVREDGAGVVYTPAFGAPEIGAGAQPSVRADLFGLGATLFATAVGSSNRSGELRDRAPWVPPRLADLVKDLLAHEPGDRPASAREVLGRLGSNTELSWESGARGTHVRETEIRRISTLEPGPTGRRVIYVDGPSGSGKSHLAREVLTRALLAGREARFIRFPETDGTFVSRLVDYLRGGPEITSTNEPLLLVLDDLQVAPVEVIEAVESFRCMTTPAEKPVVVVATTQRAPAPLAPAITLGPLDSAAFERLCRDEGLENPRELAREAAGLPGWLFASVGRVPLTAEAALARIAGVPMGARDVLALIATLGGRAPVNALADDDGLAACFAAGLLERERDGVRLSSPHLATDLATALASYAISDRAAAVALADVSLPASTLAAVARAACPPERRNVLLAESIERARREDARTIEIEMLLALLAEPTERTAERLIRLERLTRDAGIARAHPRVLAWLAEAAALDPTLAPLAERRHAEERARAGDMPAARAAAERAVASARSLASAPDEVYAMATRGSIELWSASFARAEELFESARRLAAVSSDALDREEIARLEHNVGVVALYRGHAAEAVTAFQRSTVIKRGLGDRAGVRACLLNLGLAFTRLERWAEADATLVEATALADSLGQLAGRGWCLAARADLEVRRGRSREAERHVAEAESIGDVVPKTVRADLVVLRAQIALLEGDGRAALEALARIDDEVRQEDALVDARVLNLEARSKLCLLPADRRGGARAAIASIRRARAASLADAQREAEETLRVARRVAAPPVAQERTPMQTTDEGREQESIWELLRAMAGTDSTDACIAQLARLLVEKTRAERAIVAELDDAGAVVRAWGADIDGLAIAEPALRLDADTLRAARNRAGVLYQPSIATAAGTGSRLAVARGRAAYIIEQRFRANAFDAVSELDCSRWLTLAEIALRLASPQAAPIRAEASASFPDDPRAASTFVPRRESMRDYPDIVGRSPALRRALAQLDAAVDADLSVLVEGETGTGKELFARALHEYGRRRSGPFVAVNCAAIADALFEAELFGHARGAFTGADRARGGLLARAEGGTLLLDELGELPLQRQATLLRVLEERRYRPVGRDEDRPFDVRIIAATNRDLDRCVVEGTFRKDLLYRLRVLNVAVPPLRERRGDVEPLLRHFLARLNGRASITPAALELLEAYAFPGNVRELEHLAQRLAASSLQRIDVANLPRAIRAARATVPATSEREEVEVALAHTSGNISRAADLLGLTRHGLKKRMLRLGLRGKAESS